MTATGVDVDGFTDMVVEQGDSPLWDNDDPSTWVPWGWEIKDPKKWVDYAKRATSRDHGLAPSSGEASAESNSKEREVRIIVEGTYDRSEDGTLIPRTKGQSPFGGTGSGEASQWIPQSAREQPSKSPFGS